MSGRATRRKRLRIGLYGAGRMGHIHAANLSRHPATSLAAIFDPVATAAATLAELHDVAAASTAAEILADPAIDAVMIATPEDTHIDLILAAVAAGKPIFCEKPIDIDIKRVESCVAAVERAGIPFLVGFNRRFDPSRRALQRALASGEIGRVEMIHITSRDPEPTPKRFIGGLFRNMMVHDFDMARWLLGEELVELFAYGSALVDLEIGAMEDADTAIVVMRTASGALAQINNSRRAVYGYDQRLEAFGAKGMLRVENRRETTLERSESSGTRLDKIPYFFLERYPESFAAELDHFVAVVEGRIPPLISAEDGRRALLLADAATESFHSGKPVAIRS